MVYVSKGTFALKLINNFGIMSNLDCIKVISSMMIPSRKSLLTCLSDAVKTNYSNRIINPCYFPGEIKSYSTTRLYLGNGNSFIGRYKEKLGGYFLILDYDNPAGDNSELTKKLFGSLEGGSVVYISK